MNTNDFGIFILAGILIFIIVIAVIINFFFKQGNRILLTPKLHKSEDGDKVRHYASLEVANKTTRPVSIFQPYVAFIFGHKKRAFKTAGHEAAAHNIKHISPGESITLNVDLDHYKKALGDDFFKKSSVFFIVEDSAGLEYRSGKVILDF